MERNTRFCISATHKEGKLMNIQMPILKKVICLDCGYKDEAYWGEFGSEQPCLNCDAPNSYIAKIKEAK